MRVAFAGKDLVATTTIISARTESTAIATTVIAAWTETTTIAAGTETTAIATCTGTFFTGTCFIDLNSTTCDFCTIEGFDSCISFVSVGHFNKGEALGATGFMVANDFSRVNCTVCLKCGANVCFVRIIREITNIDIHSISKNALFGKRQSTHSAR